MSVTENEEEQDEDHVLQFHCFASKCTSLLIILMCVAWKCQVNGFTSVVEIFHFPQLRHPRTHRVISTRRTKKTNALWVIYEYVAHYYLHLSTAY